MIDMACILFAGGKSSRMGQDKSLLPFGGYSSLAEFQYQRLKKIFSEVYISVKSADKFDFEAPFILDPADVDFAPTAGFVAAFESLDAQRVMVLSVDTPFVTEGIFHSLATADSPELDALIARSSSGTHPMIGLYHRSLLQEFQRMLSENDHRLGKLLGSSRTRYIDFEEEECFANLNHPHEYYAALAHFGAPGR